MSKRPSRGRKLRLAQAPQRLTPRLLTPFERELSTKRRGEISELAFALAAARHGFGISKPFGDSERYDIILDPSHLTSVIPTEAGRKRAKSRHLLFDSPRPRLVRVQVKSSTQLLNGLYHINAHRRIHGRAVPYKLSEIDFIAAYIIPEDSWFILPLPHVLGQTSLLFRPKRSRLPGLYDSYREAWHYLHEPDGLIFA
jgi:hypothetical protein